MGRRAVVRESAPSWIGHLRANTGSRRKPRQGQGGRLLCPPRGKGDWLAPGACSSCHFPGRGRPGADGGSAGQSRGVWEVTNTRRRCDHPGPPGTPQSQPGTSQMQMAGSSGSTRLPAPAPAAPSWLCSRPPRGPSAKLFAAEIQTASNSQTRRNQRGKQMAACTEPRPPAAEAGATRRVGSASTAGAGWE